MTGGQTRRANASPTYHIHIGQLELPGELHEATTTPQVLPRVDRPRPPAGRAGLDRDLSPQPLRPGRVPLPSLAHLLGLCRRGDRPIRLVGRRLDDRGAALPVSPARNLRPRFRPADAAGAHALVSAVAIRPLARDQSRHRAVTSPGSPAVPAALTPPASRAPRPSRTSCAPGPGLGPSRAHPAPPGMPGRR